MAGPRLPVPLARHLSTVLAPALAVVVIGAGALAITVAHARQARAFERRAQVVGARVVERVAATGASGDALRVRLDQPPHTLLTVATADRNAYAEGDEVSLWVDPAEPTRGRLVTEPYDLAGALTFWLGLLALSVAAVGYRAWRIRRLVGLARGGGPSWRCHGRAYHAHTWKGEREWLLLHALDDRFGPPVGGLPLLPRQPPLPSGRLDVLVRGEIRHGGTAVAEIGNVTYWPAGRIEVPGPGPPRPSADRGPDR